MVDASTLFDLLTSDVRRRLLVVLCDRDSVRVPDELLTRGEAQTASSPSGRDGSGAVSASLRRQTTQMHHVHLPKLADTGVVEWDRENGTVSRGPNFEAVEPTVRLLAENGHVLPGDFY
jgi:hypothetical protein